MSREAVATVALMAVFVTDKDVELTSTAVKDGWFTTRPVLFTIDYRVGEPWDEARLLYCEGYIDEEWQGLIQT
jgi:hypothetical protein